MSSRTEVALLRSAHHGLLPNSRGFQRRDPQQTFRLSWASSAIRFRLGISRVNRCGDGFAGLRTPESPLHPIGRALSKVAVSERLGKPCVCIWVLPILHLDTTVNRLFAACSISSNPYRGFAVAFRVLL